MKKLAFTLFVLIAAVVQTLAYDFVAYDATSKQNMYYNIIASNKVALTYKTGYNSYQGVVDIPNTVTYNGKTYDVSEIGAYAFRECSALTKIVAHSNIIKVNASACVSCPKLVEVQGLVNVEEFGQLVFRECPLLKEFNLYTRVNKIDPIAFKESSITKFNIYSSALLSSSSYTQTSNLGTLLGSQTEEVTLAASCALGDYAFAQHPSLKNVTCVNVTAVGNNSFVSCPKLQNVVLGSVASIGNYAYMNCSNLEKVAYSTTLGRSSVIKHIGTQAFRGCTRLEEFYVGDNVQTCGNGIFELCTNINLIIDNDKFTSAASLSGYFGHNDIHKVTFGEKVKTIGSSAFAIDPGHHGVKIFDIGPNVTSIAKDAFTNQKAEEVYFGSRTLLEGTSYTMSGNTIPALFNNTVKRFEIYGPATKIGPMAFSNATNLEEVVINSKALNYIETSAFSSCTKLKSVQLPVSLLEIGTTAFSACIALKSIVIPDFALAIKDGAFSGDVSLEEITIGKNMNEVAKNAFASCRSLKKLNINSPYLVGRDYQSNNLQNPGRLFGTEIQDVVIGSDVTAIGDRAFTGAQNLTNLQLSSAVKTIGVSAFADCAKLTMLYTKYVTTIGERAFEGCRSLEDISFGTRIKAIGASAFRDCRVVKQILIPETVESLGDAAFSNCPSLTKVHIFSLNVLEKDYTSSNNLHHIFGNQVVEYSLVGDNNTVLGSNLLNATSISFAPSLVTVELKRIREIGEAAFAKNTKMSDVILSDVTSIIGSNAFSNCSGLTAINLPSSLTTIKSTAFSLAGLTSIYLPKNIQTLEYGAFNECYDLETISFAPEFPCSAFDQFVFRECNSVKSITYRTDNPSHIDANNFSYHTYDYATLYVNPGKGAAFSTLNGWKNFYRVSIANTADVNLDGSVNAADVVAIYNYIVSGADSGISKTQADVNADKEVNASDVVATYNFIINGK